VNTGPEQTRPASDQGRLIDAAFAQAEKAMSSQPLPAGSTQARVVDDWQKRRSPGLADSIPGSCVIGPIHCGGQGVVYQAVQESTGRTVAIKVMREGVFAGPTEKLRFEREIQILARLKHPNIVTIHDSGVSGTSAFFVMDYIAGAPLDVYLDERDPPLQERLALFARVCEAVNVAHVRGVIHRDLKPGNIRVDDDGEPHVLDFGLAKQADWGDETSDGRHAVTMTGQFVGSLPWSSPEQAGGRVDEVDLRTDVYSLGIVFYHGLTGTFPYPVTGPLAETADHIANRPPANPRSVNAALDDEIAQILLKALRKERELRYQTAGNLGRDIERYVKGDPIEAKRDSLSYVMRKQFARHRATVAVIAAFVATVFIGFVVSLTFWSRAVRARHAEAHQKRVAQENAELALEREQRAATEAAKALAISDFLVEMLSTASPVSGAQPNVTVRDVVDSAAERVDAGGLDEQPAVEAAVRHALGLTYGSLGIFDEGQHHLDQAVELYRNLDDDQFRDRIKTQIDRGELLRARGLIDEAETVFRTALAEVRERFGKDDGDVARCLDGLCGIKRDRGDHRGAEPLCREAVDILRAEEDAPRSELATVLNDLGIVLQNIGDLKGAHDALNEAIDLSMASRGPAHYQTVISISNLGGVLKRLGRYDEAEQRYREALERTRAAVGKRHPSYAGMLNALGSLLIRQKRLDEGIEVLRQAYGVRLELFGDDHASVATTLNNMAMAYYEQGNLSGAAESFREAAEVYAKARGADHPSVATIKGNLAGVLRAAGRYEEAEGIMREVIELQRARLGPEHDRVGMALANLAVTLLDLGRLEEAEALAREAFRIRSSHLPQDHPQLADTADKLAKVLCERGELDEAEALCQRALTIRRAKFGPEHLYVAQSLNTLGLIRSEAGASGEAAEHLGRALTMSTASLPPKHGTLAVMRADHARALAGLDRLEEATRELELAADSLLESLGPGHPTTREVVHDLQPLLEASGDLERAHAWRDRVTDPG